VIKLKNILVGFLISFIGSIPLGYLNIIGFEIYKQQGLNTTICYLLGVICIEFFVIYFTLIFANTLASNKKLTKYIEGFSVIFMFALAYIFYANATKNGNQGNEFSHFGYWGTFTSGIILSGLNFIQIPFWTAWNLYLLNGNYIEVSKSRKYFYVFGTVVGTFCGMLVLILSLNVLTNQTDFLAKYLMKIIIPLVFLGLGIFQAIEFYRKYKT
jgi:threonine/homoserine/homoserine lactone efflux protein